MSADHRIFEYKGHGFKVAQRDNDEVEVSYVVPGGERLDAQGHELSVHIEPKSGGFLVRASGCEMGRNTPAGAMKSACSRILVQVGLARKRQERATQLSDFVNTL